MRFNDFIGNAYIKSQLLPLFLQNKVPHAIILVGEKGFGKKTFAKIIAQRLLCNNTIDNNPCEICLNCKKAENNTHPDVIYPEKSGALQSYSIATIRKIRWDAYVAPNEASKKIYIFSDIDNMGIPAQNALLKILEEPPKNVFFIFTCVSLSNVLPTVCSRAQQFALSNVDTLDLQNYLLKRYSEKSEENLKKIARISKGNIGLANNLLESSDVEVLMDGAKKIVLALCSAKEFDLIESVGKISENRKDFFFALDFLLDVFRDSVILSVNHKGFNESEYAKMLAKKFSIRQILKLIDVVYKTKNYLDNNVNMSILSTYFASILFSEAYIKK